MIENMNSVPNEKKQKIDEICEQIREVLEGTKDVSALRREGSLSPKLEKLIALGSVIANKRDRDVVVSCVIECLKTGATREEIMDVLRQVILMAEVPAETYDTIVREAIDGFESQD
jgi:alkylhydroperoxidase/carboxymuconolactone decarboxylase family protein YurZ